jgi:hypothetical protein
MTVAQGRTRTAADTCISGTRKRGYFSTDGIFSAWNADGRQGYTLQRKQDAAVSGNMI